MKSQFRVLIIGAGRIGALFDRPGDPRVITHAHAFASHPGFELLGFLDANLQSAQTAAALWGGQAFADLEETLRIHKPQVVCIASPDPTHAPLLNTLAAFPIQLIFVEKPLAVHEAEALEALEACRLAGVRVAVNYSRQFVPEFQSLQREVQAGTWGRLLHGTGIYGKGLLHNGSHLTNLIEWFCGPIKQACLLDQCVDAYANDPSLGAILDLDGGARLVLRTIDSRLYTIFELDLFYEKGRIRFIHSGSQIEVYEARASALYAGYTYLEKTRDISTQLDRAMGLAADRIYLHLTEGKALPSTERHGLRALQVDQLIRNSRPV